MNLAPGTPLAASLAFDDDKAFFPAGRLAMAGALPPRQYGAARSVPKQSG